MSIEKVFAIEASPEVIWDALWGDLQQGEAGAYTLDSSSRPSRLDVEVKLGHIRCLLQYRIEGKDGFSEVSATVVPISKRFGLYQVVTFGHVGRNYEMLLVTGLANLKASVEGTDLRA
jgi:hypothetical protein